MSLPLIPESVVITQNKQKDLTNSSSTLLLDEEAPSSRRVGKPTVNPQYKLVAHVFQLIALGDLIAIV